MKVDGIKCVHRYTWSKRREGKYRRDGRKEGGSNFSITGNTIKKIGESWPSLSPTSRLLFGRSLFAFQSVNPRPARRNFPSRVPSYASNTRNTFFQSFVRHFRRTNFRSLSNDPRKVSRRFELFTRFVNGVESQWEAAILRILICGNWNST